MTQTLNITGENQICETFHHQRRGAIIFKSRVAEESILTRDVCFAWRLEGRAKGEERAKRASIYLEAPLQPSLLPPIQRALLTAKFAFTAPIALLWLFCIPLLPSKPGVDGINSFKVVTGCFFETIKTQEKDYSWITQGLNNFRVRTGGT